METDPLMLDELHEAAERAEGIVRRAIKGCPVCPLTFNFQHETQSHVLADHPGEKPFQCVFPGCTKCCDDIAYWKRHLKTSHGVGPRKLCIHGCGQMLLYRRSDNFKHHVQRCKLRPGASDSPSPQPDDPEPSSSRGDNTVSLAQFLPVAGSNPGDVHQGQLRDMIRADATLVADTSNAHPMAAFGFRRPSDGTPTTSYPPNFGETFQHHWGNANLPHPPFEAHFPSFGQADSNSAARGLTTVPTDCVPQIAFSLPPEHHLPSTWYQPHSGTAVPAVQPGLPNPLPGSPLSAFLDYSLFPGVGGLGDLQYQGFPDPGLPANDQDYLRQSQTMPQLPPGAWNRTE